uniref:MSP domain-containing protein n=1 Tax=Clastoptera arizonana TaxID=38151 RepID=A0A1B6CK24_9HEMI
MKPTTYEIQELRTKFFYKIESEFGATKGHFHPADILRITKNDDWCQRFLITHDLDVDNALNMLWDTCEWRRENKVNEINENSVNIDYLEEGSLFVHNRDKDGKSLLIFKCKKHVKGQKNFEDLKRIVIYWFERIERKDKGEQVTIFFDMADTGLSNMDMEYTKYLIGLCKLYYPNFLNYILIFEMPFILNAAFKVIKNWLPSKAVQKIKFVNRSNLNDYVTPDQALRCWGGNDDYVFKFIPDHTEILNGKLEDSKKKVHFADGSPMVETTGPFGDTSVEDTSSSKLKVSPPEAVVFLNDGNDMSGFITLCNSSEEAMAFKIKTTAPEKFRVKPSYGIITPKDSAIINVVLQQGLQPSAILRDKFLIMSFPVESDFAIGDLTEAFKNTESRKVENCRLKCTLTNPGNMSSMNGNIFTQVHSTSATDSDHKIYELHCEVKNLIHSTSEIQGSIQIGQKLLALLVILVVTILVALMYLIKLMQFDDNVTYKKISTPTNENREL